MRDFEVVDFYSNRVELLRDLAPEAWQQLAEGSRLTSYEAGEVIFHQGSEALQFGVVISGTVRAWAFGEGGTREMLGEFVSGETFGETSLMTGNVILADLIAETRCEIALIPVTLFRSIIIANPSAVQKISRSIVERTKAIMADPAKASAVFLNSQDPYGLKLVAERPEKILVINCGSSSLKYSFFDTSNETLNAHGIVERIGISGTRITHHGANIRTESEVATAGGFEAAQRAMLDALTSPDSCVINQAGEVSLVVHRVVHGGEYFPEATLITANVLDRIETLNSLAPLHNPVNIAGIREMQKLFPASPHVAVFDTSFHHTLPAYAYLYGLPYELYEEQHVRRYGFHGSSHQYVSLRTAQFLKRRPNELRLVSCHLGNGASLCAVDHGRSVDTTMGFTPAEGLIMGTRCGDVDAGVIAFLERSAGMSAAQSEELLNKKSGVLGLSGISSDMREVLAAADEGHQRALLTVKAYCYRVRKYIGSYVAALGGIDAIIFTGGVGQGSAVIRALALQGLGCMGIKLDEQRNAQARGFDEICPISADDSPVQVLVVPTDEERMMAREALRTLSRSYLTQVIEERKLEPFPVEVSAHHIHLTQEHVEALFGAGHALTKVSDLSQPGQFACAEQLTIVGPRGRIERVRVLGPTRRYTQVEIAMTEQFKLGVSPPIRESGDIAETPGCVLEGPAGSVTLDRGVICAMRHIHMTPADALRYGLRDKSVVRVGISGDREIVFGDVLVRVDPNFALAMHIDTDEANAANVRSGTVGFIQEIQT